MKILNYTILSLVIVSFSLGDLKSQESSNEEVFSSHSFKDFAMQGDERSLLVRLSSDKRKIEMLRSRGLNKKADRIEEETKEINRKIIEAFKDTFDFWQVYFYNSHDSNLLLKAQDYSVLMDHDGQLVEDVSFDKPPLLCFYGTVPHLKWNNNKKFVFYEWEDFSKVKRIENAYYPRRKMYGPVDVTIVLRVLEEYNIKDILGAVNIGLHKAYNKKTQK